MSSIASMMSELDCAIAACVAQSAAESSTDESAALIELKHQIEIRNALDIETRAIMTSTTGLALPSWVPSPFKKALGEDMFHSERYVPIADLVQDAVRSRHVEKLARIDGGYLKDAGQ